MNKFLHTNITLVCTSVALALLIFLVRVNFSQQLIIEMELGQDSPAISSLGPPPRVSGATDTDKQSILEGPVYFNLRAPSWFDQAEVEIEYRDQGLTLAGVGGQIGPGFSYQVQKPDQQIELEAGWIRDKYTFSFDELYQPKNVKRFLLDAQPSRSAGGKMELRSVKVTIIR